MFVSLCQITFASSNTTASGITLEVEPFLDCDGTPVIAKLTNASDFVDYHWVLLDGSQVQNMDLVITQPGEYLIVATMSNGSTCDQNFTVGQSTTPPEFEVMVIDSVDCDTDSIPIVFNPDDLIYYIDDVLVQDNQNTIIGGGSHVIKAELGGCFSDMIIDVPYDTIIPFVEITVGDITCENPEAQLSASFNNEIFSYNWYNTMGQIIAQGEDAQIDMIGNYLMTAVADNGCTETYEFEVVENIVYPIIQATSEDLSCANLQAELSVTSNVIEHDISWKWGGITIDTLENILVEESGNYRVIVTDPENGCMTDTVMTVTSTIDYPEPILEATSFECTDTDATINVQTIEPSVEYAWFENENFLSSGDAITVDEPGSYILESTNTVNGCIHLDTIVVEDFRDFPDEFDFSYEVGCGEEDVEIILENINGGTAPYSLRLDGELMNSGDILQLLSGDHLISVEDSEGCSYDTSFNVQIRPVLEISVIIDTTINWPDSVELDVRYNRDISEIVSFNWNTTASLSCVDCEITTVRPIDDVTVNILVEDIYGCLEERTIQVNVDKTVEVYIPNAFSPNNDGNNDFFTAFGSSRKVASIKKMSIYDRWGNPVYDETNIPINDESAGWNGRKNFRVIEAGVYIYYIIVEDIDGIEHEFSGSVTMAEKQY